MSQQTSKKFNSKTITELALLIALEVILSRFLSIHTPIVRIGFGFLPLAIMGILYGSWTAGIAAIFADLIGFILFPTGTYFPGFTLTAFLTGFTYGILLYNKPKYTIRILISVLVVCLILNLVLDTLWLSILMGKGYIALLPTRIIKVLVMIPVQFISISLVWNKFLIRVKSSFNLR
ncbi:folate family ECF transporter S component [Romboutsia maritimum]|uniref:Folate family ECF transporter S component n=1 Tax=Romboutsia maritimum TaxID=2020948 RepID=A0A371IS73_9FIRM|nr:folate family ECF transporter S component [Romboutsia maritimum]RDY23324.1 folate family ECF transporter S component [Romboutsia maritimum]